MNARFSWEFLSLCLSGAQSSIVAQKTPVQQTIAVEVADVCTEPTQPDPAGVSRFAILTVRCSSPRLAM
jgi:hypothetical protein